MRSNFVLICLSLLSFSIVAQEEVGDMKALTEFPESIALMRDAKDYTDAIMNDNFNRVVELTHNDVIKMGGGEGFMTDDLKAENNIMKAQGFLYKNCDLGSHPEFMTSEGELQTILPIKFLLSYNADDVESWINLFAVSQDEGKNWKFVNLEKFDEVSLREFVSNVSNQLVYPK